MTDINKLPLQSAKTFVNLDYDNIMSLYDYHPWDHGNNPNIDQITHKILNFKKDGVQPSRKFSVRMFSSALRGSIIPLITTNNNICCVVPSHTKDKVSVGMIEVLNIVYKGFKFTNSDTHLRRVYDVEKAATGGPRSIQLHLDSITVDEPEKVKGKTVFLFDDVTSTGASLQACKQLLLEAGAAAVVMIAIGHTR